MFNCLILQLQDMKTVSTTEADDNQSAQVVEADSHCSSQVDFLRFEVNFILKLFRLVSPLYKKLIFLLVIYLLL